MVTIKDVAKKAGVAPSTVTRVIQNSDSISEQTKAVVRNVMQEMNYFPNLNARSLASKKSSTLGLILPNATDAFYQNPFFPTVLRGINAEATKLGYSLLLTTGQSIEERKEHVQNIIYGRQVAGVIFLYAEDNDPVIRFVLEQKFPHVIIGKVSQPNACTVDNDNQELACVATTRLIEKGYQKIGFLGGHEQQNFIKDRYNGYKQALIEHDIAIKDEYTINGFDFLPEDGERLAEQLSKQQEVQAWVIADELVAAGFVNRWHQLTEQNVPVATFQAHRASLLGRSELIGMNIKALHLGHETIRLLDQWMSEAVMPSPNRVLIEHEIIEY
ncbi:LacI family DNA-binding transcriptional regulator [Tuanshanicoccus lijuaniae]|uniref:LacI family DNA-binding transcriptional regulator n=1 Tax=Aerococcaceae bacterium zg-1292 TaxID=2774330 RepID=UPI001935CC13|nr:LacI family DNA-binding transcriptional regulator [Aerococcaceae bacterium zg-1292]MBF6626159.1 LacI family DNA-binding transcriptional regulator [Aerococcaceae bacterium zg-BR9]MBF6978020.1 LacI family DNA-binding transcriptional regulator [Aerococcaceae bacterium zg-BR22]MBS4456044.1 LacI family DNA-binding transcriptional regulator [Aerococcaceae bacterium zg-A91]MBS4457796.1 LacI family DNA-binding transcriptional regulator [Aerococcaceae bacterium zg-BR33]